MAQDVFSKMAEDPWLLKEDGYLNADTDLKKIVYHPSLNVILICTSDGIVRVLDVNSGVVLHSSYLSAQNQSEVTCRYIPNQDRILFCDGQAIGVRSDYNGVLLLDTILQKPVSSSKENVKIELLLSEAIILKQSLTSTSNVVGIDHVINELTDKILEAQKLSKKGIKAQKWNTVCLDLPLDLLSSAAVNTVSELIFKNQHTPELGVASAVQERLSELLGETTSSTDRRAMASEAKRRDTFTNWPHMDYKWALPDQMAQAGFYHQPNASGDDRAMCFTCTVCLVCWERTDEPWSEHERHSPSCPFVMGEYTQNVPLSVTYATNPAIDATYRGVPVKTLGTSSVSNLLATANSEGLISVFDVSGRLKRTHSFYVTQFDSHILEKFTQDFGVPGNYSDSDDVKYPTEKKITALAIVGQRPSMKNSPNAQTTIRPTIICSLYIRCRAPNKIRQSAIVEAMNDQNKNETQSINIMEVDVAPTSAETSCLYLVVYDFQYTKEQSELENENNSEASDLSNNRNDNFISEDLKQWFPPYSTINENENSINDQHMDIASSASDDISFIPSSTLLQKNFDPLGSIIKQQMLYQNLIPGESDEIFLPPVSANTKQHSGPRALPFDLINTETDAAQATSMIIPPDYSFMNGQLGLASIPMDANDKSISDHIAELKNTKTNKKLNYSRAVQCVSLPEQFKYRKDLDISDILPTPDGGHVLVVLTSSFETKSSALLEYSLNFSSKMVKLNETPVLARELNCYEKPIEVSLLSLDGNSKNSIEGIAIMVCVDGAVRVIELNMLKMISVAKLDCEKFVSAAYCNSLERLCASTENGSLHFYALNDADNESSEDHEEENLFGLNSECASVSNQPADSLDNNETTHCFQEPTDYISYADLQRFLALCSFEPLKAGYCAVVPPCWSEMQQAQRQRRQPQNLQLDNDQHSKTWRLQTDTTTWDEHVFEITLPSPMCLGHVDVHFTLHSSTVPPHVEITLLRQNTTGIGHKRDVKFAVDEIVTFDALQYADNPVTSQEYLRAHNAEILAGPIDIASCLDLTEQGGCVTLTSPKLFKSRNRTLLLHLKAVYSKDESNKAGSSKGKRFENRTAGAIVDKLTQSSRKSEFYMGCDCLHELSITVYSSKHTDIPHERTQRTSMLESNVFIQSLLHSVVNNNTTSNQNLVLDILNWIASIRLTRNRSQNGEAPSQQLEFLKIIEAYLQKFLHNCLLIAGREVSHKCAKLVVICSNGARNISDQVGNHFDNCILETLLELLDSINKVHSAAGLQWIILLLYKVVKPNHTSLYTTKCTNLLSKVSDELFERTNPYHLLLRSRFGLYGTPLEPELFDVEPPPPVKPTSTTVTYASVVAGENNNNSNADLQNNFSFNKEHLDPREVLSTCTVDSKIKLKNIAPSKIIRGLLETEPLHFTCIAASDGTRVERADIGNNSFIPFTVHSISTSTPEGTFSTTKKDEIEQFLSDFADVITNNKNDKNGNSSQGTSSTNNISFSDGVYHMFFHSDNVKNDVDFTKLISDTLEFKIESEKKNKVNNQNKSVWRAEDIMSPNKCLPWQQLLVAPPQQVIVVERMHSGARRYVTLDFGQPILLTDVLIPICHDLVSISIDLWLKGEDVDGMRLVVASDIGTKNLILNDLQPPPRCRYMKITTVGRYGMSTTRCRIPTGYFYGHLIVLPEEVNHGQLNTYSDPTYDLDKQLNVLSKLFEDVSCRYSLACSKLKDLLHPFLMSDITNASHLSAYMNVVKDKLTNFTNSENSKIFSAYQEAMTYQRQLNTVRNVMSRIEGSLSSGKQEKTSKDDLGDTCTDKLRAISEGLLEILLSAEKTPEIDLETCQKLFQGLCVLQGSRVQLLAATLLDRSCGKKPFWGNFLADTLAEMFSSSYAMKFPQDRVFILLAYLGRRCPDRSAVVDATLRVISQVLKPLGENRPSLLAISVDMPLLGWLLMFLSLQLDLNKGSLQSSSRWDWVLGEMCVKVHNENTNNSYRKKLHKKFLQYKQQLENLDWTQKMVQSSAQVQALQSLSNHAANLTSKLEAALKTQENFLKKVKQYKTKESKTTDSDLSSASKTANKRRRELSEPMCEKHSSLSIPVHLNPSHSLAVTKGLLTFVLAMDHSCSADMFLLACKVIARLVNMSKISLGQFMSEEQLLKFVNLCITSELPWAPHVLACLLQDVLEATRPQSSETDMETENSSASTSWGNTGKDLLSDVESLCETFGLEDTLMPEPLTKQGKTTVNNNNNHLPSVYESDDSSLEDFLDDILERGRTLLKKSVKGAHSTCNTSCALDSRLESGVEISSEITLRKLITCNIHSLLQNINTTSVPTADSENEIPPWPLNLIVPWQILPQTSATNRSMLVGCFDTLFKDIQLKSPLYIENVLQLWLTLNCMSVEEKFDPSTIPFISLSVEAVNSLVSAIAWSPNLSLRTWCMVLQTLTLVCNLTHVPNESNSHWSDHYGLHGLTSCLINHPDFVQLLLRLLSGTGIVFFDKELAGPSLCKALHDFLVRIQMRCDVVSPNSRPGSLLKSLLLKVVYQLVQPNGPLASRQGALDAQCKLLQSMDYLDYCNADLSIAMSILESTGVLVYTYVSNSERIKCVNIGERLSPTPHLFSGIFASVLGSESNKQDRPVSWDLLLVALLKLLGKLVQTPLPSNGEQQEAMDTEPPAATSQTDESKAEQIQQDSLRNNPPVPCLADTVLQHHPSVIRLCQSLALCKASSLSMLANISQQNTFADLGEPGTIGDAVFLVLAALAKKASRKELIIEPLLMFLSQAPQLSEPLLWFILQVLDTEDALRKFLSADGIRILGQSLVMSNSAANTISHSGTISMVMQHFAGCFNRSDANTAIASASATKKLQQAGLENMLALVNFAPFSTIRCQSTTAQPADVLIQGGAATHRRARTPQWSYHFYPEEAHTELTLQLPTAILLREVHLQPHLSALATCPSAVALEVSANGPAHLVPTCPPLPTSGMTFIRLHLPIPEVVNCVQLRLYKPRDANNIGLSQIRLLGTSAFGGNIKQQILDLSEDESHCKHSLGWLRLLHHCFTLSSDSHLTKEIIASAAQVPDLLLTCCGLLLVPTHIPALYLPNLEKVLCELSLFDRESGLNAIKILLECKSSISEPLSAIITFGKEPLLLSSIGSQSACELLYQICGHQDSDTYYRMAMVLEWLQSVAQQAVLTKNTENCSPAYVSCIASILWTANQSNITYNLSSMITLEFFDAIYRLKTVVEKNVALKYALDSLLCSLCYINPEFFPLLLQRIGVLVPNLSTDHGASISDDRKDSESMTDDTKQSFESDSEWYGRLVMGTLSELNLSNEQLETIALVSRSPTAIQQLIDSGLPKLLNSAILEFCNSNTNSTFPMAKLENVTAILKFFADISDEKTMRDWLGSVDGSSFWLHLLHWLCKKNFMRKSSLQSESHAQLEEVCVRFLSKCCLCHPSNQTRLAKVLCEVIALQYNGITGFMRRLILQLLLENEKIPVSIKADETLYKNTTIPYTFLPVHPAFKQTHDRAFLYLSTNTTIADILEQHISFSASLKNESGNLTKKDSSNKGELIKGWWSMAADSDLSVAAGVTAKDKRAKDAKNQMTCSTPKSKKKRYASSETNTGVDAIEGRTIDCDALPGFPLPLNMSLGQLLRLIESKGMTSDWPCIHLTIHQNKNSDDKNNRPEINPSVYQRPFSSALQVFSSMGGLALLAQHLPTVYPETVRAPSTEKVTTEQSESDWVKVDDVIYIGSDDIYEDIEDVPGSSVPSKSSGVISNVPPHSLTAFGLFLRLPGYAEVLLKDMKKALCLLRLVLGVTDDGEGGDIFQTPVADSLPTLPFEVLRKLYDATPLSTDDGRLLRRISINIGVVHLLLACLGIFTHQTQSSNEKDQKDKAKDDRGQLYWAKGTGFGTGSTQQSWNVEQALMKQRSEEEHVTVLLQVLASYINPGGKASDELADNVLPPTFYQLLANSSLLPALCSYLRNDSVLDMARHIPLYRSTLQLLRAIAASSQLVTLLLPQKSNSNGPSVSSLLKNMKTCVDTYASKLRSAESHKTVKKFNGNNKSSNTKYKIKFGEQLEEMERDEGLALLMPDIQATATMVCSVTDRLIDSEQENSGEAFIEKPLAISLEERYLKVMKNLQFDTFEMITELPEGGYKFVVSHHFENNARSAGEQSHPARVKRLAQEAVTLATSLPLSYSSSVFVRCDTDRLDIMKVLITGPADTPYANGCFELDVFFPPDYPLSPMMINLETTGHHTVRFNPNLYNDGKVCLSVLNTWHGRPEEKWNAQTSSFLQVLVSIQSLILVPEPYFNEPGYERSRGSPSGTQSSKEYNTNICQATVRWAMLEQIINPCPCFKDVIQAHFYLKKHEIIAQVEGWIKDLENDVTEKKTSRCSNKRSPLTNIDSFKKIFQQLKEKLLKLSPPEGLEEELSSPTSSDNAIAGESTPQLINGYQNEHHEIDTDIDMEKMVNDMCE